MDMNVTDYGHPMTIFSFSTWIWLIHILSVCRPKVTLFSERISVSHQQYTTFDFWDVRPPLWHKLVRSPQSLMHIQCNAIWRTKHTQMLSYKLVSGFVTNCPCYVHGRGSITYPFVCRSIFGKSIVNKSKNSFSSSSPSSPSSSLSSSSS